MSARPVRLFAVASQQDLPRPRLDTTETLAFSQLAAVRRSLNFSDAIH
jgi:hypothetical protein